ncbi:hypothetical protein ACFWY5_41260 [Nonomuraea sp. NPDC059007]|uniref:hypothetical protein n=1 Tax=Nonomuraea sp. NPDC059007 TaxID=3346692 RepID=UPI0036CEC338
MLPFHDLGMPAQDDVRADDKPKPAQDRSEQRSQERRQEEAVFRGESHPRIGAELPLQDHELMAQRKNLDILIPITQVDRRVVQEIAGHASVTSQDPYSHVTDSDSVEAVEMVAAKRRQSRS